MNKLINSPQNLGKTEPLGYIEATKRAGYEGIGIRTNRSPGRTYNFNPIVGNRDLERDVLHQQYMADMDANCRTALTTVDPTPHFQKYGENNWAAVKSYLDAVTDAAAAPVIA